MTAHRRGPPVAYDILGVLNFGAEASLPNSVGLVRGCHIDRYVKPPLGIQGAHVPVDPWRAVLAL